MDTEALIDLLQESLYLVIVLVAFFSYASWRGGQALTNLILGLYLSLLISSNFPYYHLLPGADGVSGGEAASMIIVFIIFTILATCLFSELMPEGDDDGFFSGFGKNIGLSLLATILVMAYSFHVLPVTALIDTGTPIQTMFATPDFFFFWLLLPLPVLWIYYRLINR